MGRRAHARMVPDACGRSEMRRVVTCVANGDKLRALPHLKCFEGDVWRDAPASPGSRVRASPFTLRRATVLAMMVIARGMHGRPVTSRYVVVFAGVSSKPSGEPPQVPLSRFGWNALNALGDAGIKLSRVSLRGLNGWVAGDSRRLMRSSNAVRRTRQAAWPSPRAPVARPPARETPVQRV